MKKIIGVFLFGLSNLVSAEDGVLTLNSICVGFGCVPGDSSGFPITINNPGSYKLTSNLVSNSTSSHVIDILSDNVTLDLNGFSIIGPRTCTGARETLSCTDSGMTARGIQANSRKNIVVKNGTVSGFSTGVRLEGTSQLTSAVYNIQATQNSVGIVVYSVGSIISDSIANRNLVAGFDTSVYNVFIKDSSAYGNMGDSVNGNFSTCSNVFFVFNGDNNSCGRYRNESTCGSGAGTCP